MPDAPPAIIMPAPEIPAGFRLENLGVPLNVSLTSGDCGLSEDGDIVICGNRIKVSGYRIAVDLPPPPMDDLKEPLVFKKGNLEFGWGRKGLGLRVKF